MGIPVVSAVHRIMHELKKERDYACVAVIEHFAKTGGGRYVYAVL